MQAALQAVLFGASSFYPGASLALDFLAQKFRAPGMGGPSGDFTSVPGLTVTRSTAGYADTMAGGLVLFPANAPRITDKGLLIEGSRTNLFLNALAPATQTITITATSHTITVWGSGSVTIAAGTATITNAGAASAGSPRTIGCTVGGTITATVSGSPTGVNVEAGTYGTSLMPSTGSTFTRSADNVSIGGLFGPAAVSWVAEWLSSPSGTARVAAYTNASGTFASPQGLVTTQGGASSVSFGGSGSGISAAITATTAGVTVIKLAGMANASGTVQRISSQAGAAAGNTTLDYTGVGTAKLQLGALDSSVTQPLDGYLRRLIIYPRPFSDAELVAAST